MIYFVIVISEQRDISGAELSLFVIIKLGKYGCHNWTLIVMTSQYNHVVRRDTRFTHLLPPRV